MCVFLCVGFLEGYLGGVLCFVFKVCFHVLDPSAEVCIHVCIHHVPTVCCSCVSVQIVFKIKHPRAAPVLHRSMASSAPRFELVNALDGKAIAERDYSSRIFDNTDISWVVDIAARELGWPRESLSIVVGERTFKWSRDSALRDRTKLKKLRDEGVKDGDMKAEDTLRVGVICHAPPEECGSEEGGCSCICDFRGHGCCVTGRTDGVSPCREQIMQRGQEAHYGCRWCGEGGCCRSGNCGHPCCEEYDKDGDRSID